MLETQKYLQIHGIDKLVNNFALETCYHPIFPLVSLKYNQIESPKYHEITRECRTLILELDTWKLVAKGFRRFFNIGEGDPEDFNWNEYRVEEKVDGSVILLFNYANQWIMSTSRSWGDQPICGEFTDTWHSLFFKLLPSNYESLLNYQYTYVFELTSLLNKVVLTHPEPKITLLSSFDNHTALELPKKYNDDIANSLNIRRPKIYDFENKQSILDYLSTITNFEGFVLVDNNLKRKKGKSDWYIRYHHLKNNGNYLLTKHIIPMIMKDFAEKDEITAYFPELRRKWDSLEEKINNLFKNADEIYNLYLDYDKKQFALAIKGESLALKAILFESRKLNKLPSANKIYFTDCLIKFLK